MFGGYGGNGHFVRARTEEDAKRLIAEQEQRRRLRLRLPAAGAWLGWVVLAVLAAGLVVLWVLYG